MNISFSYLAFRYTTSNFEGTGNLNDLYIFYILHRTCTSLLNQKVKFVFSGVPRQLPMALIKKIPSESMS